MRKFLSVALPLACRVLYRSRPRREPGDPRHPRRILVLNGAHIGDIVISTSILPILRSAYPGAQIGFVAASWSKMVLENHPDVDYLHTVDHFLLNRSNQRLLHKIRQHRSSHNEALREIKRLNYDLAICMYTYKLADLLETAWAAGIPVRLGFRGSLLASLATGVADLPGNPFLTQSALQAEVLRPLALDKRHLTRRRATLPHNTRDATREVCALLEVPGLQYASFCVIHMGSGARNRELPTTFWREVAELLSRSHTLVFTGKGQRERDNIAHVISGLSRCINACDRLSWSGFVAAIRSADVVYGVESMAGHVAAAVGTRCVVAYTGIAGVACWRPESDQCTVLTNHLPCAPCQDFRGCEQMSCLQRVRPEEFLGIATDTLPRNIPMTVG